jgi:hypothetical protein
MKADRQLVRLVAEAEAARLILERTLLLEIEGDALSHAIAARVASIEAVSEHLRLVPTSPHAFVPACDRHVRHQHKNRRPNPAA